MADYSGLEIVKGDALGNAERAELFEYRRQLAKLHQPVDRGEWWMTPQTVNAVNLPLQNALNFPGRHPPAAVFRRARPTPRTTTAPWARSSATRSATASTTRAASSTPTGRLANWWTKDDFEHFKAAGEALAAQFDAYRPFPDLAVNGHQTLSENIADVAGLLAAYDAYRLSLDGKPDAVKEGLHRRSAVLHQLRAELARQRSATRQLRREIATDGHAPEQYRAVTVRNLDAWYDAFSVAPSQKLYLAPPQRVHVW